MTETTPHPRVELYDTTLRDGTQGIGVSLSVVDKLRIAQLLDVLGFDFIEGGYPLSNPKDVAFFEQARDVDWQHAKLTAFGMTRRKDIPPEADTGLNALVDAKTPVITIVGKTWDLHVDEVLRVDRDENLAMIRDSVGWCRENMMAGGEVSYDAEHFFDGYRANPDYALSTLRAAADGGATRLVLCDTNGGSLPGWITQSMQEVQAALGPQPALAIHCHNDAGVAVANTLTAIDAGAVQAQGTINGIGERCGNVDLITVAADLALKLGRDVLHPDALPRLKELSDTVYELANVPPTPNQPYVGPGAFAHKGGMHVHAVQRIAHSYEHVAPESVGNERRILVSELSGVSNVVATLGKKFGVADDKALQRRVLEKVQDMEHAGYQFEQAPASFELLMRDALGQRQAFWALDHYRCTIVRRGGHTPSTDAAVKMTIDGKTHHEVAEGDGPINALDGALRKCLRPCYPQIDAVHLTDYQVRVVNPTAESAAKVRVVIEFAVKDPNDASTPLQVFSTIGVNENIVDASWEALGDAFQHFLLETELATSVDARATA
ncbi:MAG: citramalate synthase [Planctomycetota bacterium]